jgi:hypothetical protein
MEQYEIHRELLDLPQYVFPIGMLVFGYPTPEQLRRPHTKRFDETFILFENRYHRLEAGERKAMFAEKEKQFSQRPNKEGIANFGQAMYFHKFDSDFSREMSRSVKMILEQWLK